MTDLSIFNEPKHPLPLCRKPFRVGEHSYYTNQHICIRVDADNDHAELKAHYERIGNKIVGYFTERTFDTNLLNPLPELETFELKDCDVCHGSGKFKHCPECIGSGSVLAETDFNLYEATCKTCDGAKTPQEELPLLGCFHCNETGKTQNSFIKAVELDGQKMTLGYAHKISSLPNLKIGFENGAYSFTFNGGRGVLMPIGFKTALSDD